MKKASAAKAELGKASDVFKSLYRGLKSANNSGEAWSSAAHKRKREEALEEMQKASQTMKQMRWPRACLRNKADNGIGQMVNLVNGAILETQRYTSSSEMKVSWWSSGTHSL